MADYKVADLSLADFGRKEIDLAQVDAALSKLTPIDAIKSQVTASAYAAHLLYGALLRNAGPLTLTGDPLPKNAAQIELRLPLR